MKPGEAFELHCYEYLKKCYQSKEVDFYREGGMDSTKSDIAARKNGEIAFYIEVKDASAQSGQFVLFPDEERETFVFSPRNRSEQNTLTTIIIDYMNRNFQRFHHAGTAGHSLDIDTAVFADWIIGHYKSKNVKYVISRDSDYVIFPIRKFGQYFQITATYRIKKSGSGRPAKKDIPAVQQMLTTHFPAVKFSQEGNKLFADIPTCVHQDRFALGKYTYYLSKQPSGSYEVRRLSNTYHMNVIFSIELKKAQDKADLAEFISDL